MDIHPWTKYDVARARDEERLLRAMAAYKALRGADGGAIDPLVEPVGRRFSIGSFAARSVRCAPCASVT
jgi:hypothetical protein